MSFRRSFSKIEHGNIHKKAILLTTTVVLLIFLIKKGYDFATAPPPIHYIGVVMHDPSKFIINGDTTNFDDFASILKEQVIDARRKHDYNNILIILNLPKKLDKTADIADIVKVVDAMDVPYDIKTWN